MIVSRSEKLGEPDLLLGNEQFQLRFVTLENDRNIEVIAAPIGGWTHNALEAIKLPDVEAWNAFLGQQWIGSSEI